MERDDRHVNRRFIRRLAYIGGAEGGVVVSITFNYSIFLEYVVISLYSVSFIRLAEILIIVVYI